MQLLENFMLMLVSLTDEGLNSAKLFVNFEKKDIYT